MTSALIVSFCLCLVVINAAPGKYYQAAAPIQYQPAQQQQAYEDRDYKFAYAVHDDATYNQHSRQESKYGNTVSGQYTVLEPSGDLRVVNYIADDQGFRAEVQKQGAAAAAVSAPYPAPQNLKATYARAFRH